MLIGRFRILITGEQSGLVETITDAVSVHSIKKGEYARRISEGGPIGQVSLMDHFVNVSISVLLISPHPAG
jgi:phosphatidylinositol 4-kinase